MALSKGTQAPNFSLPSTSDEIFNLEQMKGKPLILFFYPKDFTNKCTQEACEFRDQFSEFKNLNIPVFGISRDDIPTHKKFKKAYKLPFDLLSDEDGSVCKAFDALIPLIKMPKRVTYLLDENLRIVSAYEGLFESKTHVEAMIRQIRK